MNTDDKAIDLILARGVVFRMPAPRPFGRLRFKMRIRPLYLGTILEVWKLRERADELEVQAEIIAVAVLNSERLFNKDWLRRRLTRYIFRHVRSDSLVELYNIVMELTRERDFMKHTIWATLLGSEVMQPKGRTKGS